MSPEMMLASQEFGAVQNGTVQNGHAPGNTPDASEAMLQMIFGTWISQTIYVAASLGIADRLTEEPQHIDTLAQAIGVNSGRLYRLMRALASVGVFVETEPRIFAQTANSEYLRSDIPESLRSLSMMLSDEWSWQSWGELLNVIKTGELPLQYLYQKEDAYEYFAENPESGKLFDNAMISFTRNALIPTILKSYDFTKIHRMADLGGGHGTLIAAILAAYPQMQGVLFDRPSVVGGATALLQSEGVADRCEVVSGNFFESVPAGCDAYLVSQILHNFDNEKCLTILRNIRSQIPSHGKLLIIQGVIPTDNQPHFNKFLDLELMIIDAGGQERTAAQYSQLFETAGFRLNQIVPPVGAEVNVLEGIPV